MAYEGPCGGADKSVEGWRGLLHADECSHIPIPTGTEFKPIGNLGRDGGWFSVGSEAEARMVLLKEFPAGVFVRCQNCL